MDEILHFALTPALDTGAYAAGDVLFGTTLLQSTCKNGIIKGVTIIDKDDVGESCDLWFLAMGATIGVANSPPTISDADAPNLIGVMSSVAANKDLGGVRVGTVEFEMGFDVREHGGLYVAGITNGALTHSAAGIVLTFRILTFNR